VAVAAPPVPAGQARVWFYRPLEPYGSLNLARIDANGSFFGATPESFGRDFNQDKDVDLGPVPHLYVKIVSSESWGVGLSGSRNFKRDTVYAWLIPQEVARGR
jgi:hypothetical protein